MFLDISSDTLVGVWEIDGGYVNCFKCYVNCSSVEVECRHSKYLDDEVQGITFDVIGGKFIQRGGEYNIEYTGEGEMLLLDHTSDIYGRKILEWEGGITWKELGTIPNYPSYRNIAI